MKSTILIFVLASMVSIMCFAEEVVPQSTPQMEQVAEPAAPPQWAEDLIMSVEKLPIIGPIVSKILVYLGIVSSILTAFIAFLLTALNSLSVILSLSGLAKFAEKVKLFKDGKIMYWLKYLSLFNAKKPVKPIIVPK